MKSYFTVLCFLMLFLLSTFTSSFAQQSEKEKYLAFAENEYNFFATPTAVSTYTVLDSAELDSFIRENMSGIAGLATTIIKNNKIVWNGNYGYRDIENHLIINDSTAFLLASVSKTITATALMQLWEQGFFQLDDNINDYLPPGIQVINPWFSDVSITFRHLLTHTSSINENYSFVYSLMSWGSDSPIPLDSLCNNYFDTDGIYYDQNRTFNSWAPGTQYEYSNEGTTLIAYLVQLISGIDFDQYCQENIFNPLKLKNTSWTKNGLDTSNLAIPYSNMFTPYGYSGNPFYPAGWLKSCSEDLLTYIMMYHNGGYWNGNQILQGTTIDTMCSIQFPNIINYKEDFLGGIGSHGLGLHWHWYENPHLNNFFGWYKGGGLPGVDTFTGFAKRGNNFSFIFLSNADEHDPGEKIFEQLFLYSIFYNEIYPDTLWLNKPFLNKGIDSLHISAEMKNQRGAIFDAFFLYTNTTTMQTDSINLFDDGLHGDGQADDNIWGNLLAPISDECEFMTGVSTIDLHSGRYFFLNDLMRFTTIGPLEFDRYRLTDTLFQTTYQIKLSLRNKGSSAIAPGITAELSSSDTNVTNISPLNNDPIDIPAGQTVETEQIFNIGTKGSPSNVLIHIDLYSNGYHYWSDSLNFLVNHITEIKDNLPKKYSLSQNYPNPFNPSTTIEFSIPKSEFVILKIYNLLGQEVAILVSDRLTPGNYNYTWDASGFASGLYYYKMKAGKNVQTKKLLLIK